MARDRAGQVDDVLGGLSSPTAREVMLATKEFDPTDVVAAVGKRVLGGGDGGSQPIQSVSIAVTSAEILALFSAPLQIVAAPGAGKAIMLVAACGSLSAGTSYTVADGVYLGSAAGVIGDFGTGFRLANLSNALVNPAPNVAFDPLAGVGSQTSDWDNQPLSLIADVSDPTGGTLDLALTVLYTVVDL